MASRKQSQLAKRAIAMETGSWEGKHAYYRSNYHPWLDKHHALESSFKVFRPLLQHNIEHDDLHLLAKLHHDLGFSYLRAWVKAGAERTDAIIESVICIRGARPVQPFHDIRNASHVGVPDS